MRTSHVTALLVTLFFSVSAAVAAIPPSADNAEAVLKKSPRHGEWVEIPLPASDGQPAGALRTWVVYPERKEKAPVVLVIHEIFGLTPWVRGVADQLAADGFIAVAPDFLSGKGPGGGGTDSFKGDEITGAVRKLTAQEVADRLDAARAYAIALPAADGKTATIGFCWGGSQSFMYATAQPELNAAVVYYGTGPEQSKVASINCPVLGLYGSDDARVNATIEPTAKAMQASDKRFTHKMYEGAGHGFLRQQEGRDGANMKASNQAWEETLKFLRENLK